MDEEDQTIIDFALLWQPYRGRRRDEIFLRFDMTPERFTAPSPRFCERPSSPGGSVVNEHIV